MQIIPREKLKVTDEELQERYNDGDAWDYSLSELSHLNEEPTRQNALYTIWFNEELNEERIIEITEYDITKENDLEILNENLYKGLSNNVEQADFALDDLLEYMENEGYKNIGVYLNNRIRRIFDIKELYDASLLLYYLQRNEKITIQ